MSPYYGGARLIPLCKKDGGVRPLAVGETLRRFVCKLAIRNCAPQFQEHFYPPVRRWHI
jgi:hypothetical protein